MALKKPFDEVGRGNIDRQNSFVGAATGSSFLLRIASGSDSGSAFATPTTITVPIVGGSATIEIAQTITGTPTIEVEVLPGDSGSAVRAKVVTALNGVAPFDAVTNVAGRAGIHIKLADAGLTTLPTISQPSANSNEIPSSGFVPGRDGINFDEPSYIFDGPFENVIPTNDPLQGMLKQVRIVKNFFDTVVAETTISVAGIRTAAIAFKTANDAAFPGNEEGISGETGKITIKGYRRDLVRHGRGTTTIADVFSNEVADYSIRQLMLRLMDNTSDFIEFLSSTPTAAEIKTFLGNFDESFDIAFGELDRAVGADFIAYDNTLVRGSSDQGFLHYLDEIVDNIESIASQDATTPTFAGLITDATVDKLLLRN